MKNPAGKFSGQAIKLFFLSHFEKMIFGICLLLGIWTLTNNQWRGIQQAPRS